MDLASLNKYLILSGIIFSIGIIGSLRSSKSVINLLMSIELMFLAVNINLVSFSTYLQDMTGQIFTIVILTVAAAEVAIGLAILLIHNRNSGSIQIKTIKMMKG